jgi:hypothetical protein
MKILISLLGIVLLATSLAAQDAPIPQNLPLPLRQTSEAVQRKVEQPIPPQGLPLPRPANRLDNRGLLNRLRLPNRLAPATDSRVNAAPLEERIDALEAKLQELQNELEAQKALIKQLQELLDQQQKKN